MIEDPHGDAWAERIRRQHERHAGLPDASWWCPGFGPRPQVPVITSAMLAQQRITFERARTRRYIMAAMARRDQEGGDS